MAALLLPISGQYHLRQQMDQLATLTIMFDPSAYADGTDLTIRVKG